MNQRDAEYGHFGCAENWMRYHHIEGFVTGEFRCIGCGDKQCIAFTKYYEPKCCASCGSLVHNIWFPYVP